MKNFDIKEQQVHISDPVERYFECVSSCDMNDGICISRCIEILKNE